MGWFRLAVYFTLAAISIAIVVSTTWSIYGDSGDLSDNMWCPAYWRFRRSTMKYSSGVTCNVSAINGAKSRPSLKHGDVFDEGMCLENHTLVTSNSRCCMGNIHPYPHCVPMCVVDNALHANTVVLKHGTSFWSSHCHKGFRSMTASRCYLGKMTATPVCKAKDCDTTNVSHATRLTIGNEEQFHSHHCRSNYSLINAPSVCKLGEFFPEPVCARWCSTDNIKGAKRYGKLNHGEKFNSKYCRNGLKVKEISTCIDGSIVPSPACEPGFRLRFHYV